LFIYTPIPLIDFLRDLHASIALKLDLVKIVGPGTVFVVLIGTIE
jgi:hypothetical protein